VSSIASIVQAVDFVEEHLRDKLSVADIAAAVSYSVYYFCRLFNRHTHHSPYDYLMRRRLAESARELLESDRRIIDIALDYQFGSPEAYSRAFKRNFGLPPRRCRQRGCLDRRLTMSRLTAAHIEHRSQGAGRQPVLEQRDDLRVVGLMTLTSRERTAVPALWQMLYHELGAREGPGEKERVYGLASYPTGWQLHGFCYMAAVEVRPGSGASPALVEKTIPGGPYVRFLHAGPYSDLQLSLDYIYHTWLPRSGRLPARHQEIECFGPGWPRSGRSASQIPILIPLTRTTPQSESSRRSSGR
jgi:AraC family transcriptional regulator